MNRIIKFRAWDKELNTMHDWNYLSGWTPRDWVKSGVNVMQFTGLHDKNGKEIYEGDVAKLTDEDKNAGNYPIVWSMEEAGFMVNGFHLDHYMAFLIGMSIEVIGNIHENPELLN